ncbi:sorting nexin-25-like isoform X2 [Watersipora subatra]|uniref:sorting nexin-25-like isoform X2 n=1 Tax=Watersipora subatra TaxID=2589382 RepID=UPI00355C45C9
MMGAVIAVSVAALAMTALSSHFLSHFLWYDIIRWSSLLLCCGWGVFLATRSKFSNISRIYPEIDPSLRRFCPLPTFKVPKRHVEQCPVPVVLHLIISQLVELVLRDFVNCWYTDLVTHGPQTLIKQAKKDLDYVNGSLCKLLSSADYLELIATDVPSVLTEHIQRIQQASTQDRDATQPFILHECAADPAKEEAHLLVLSRIFCYKLLPPHHDKLSMDLAINIFAKQVLQSTVNHLTNPSKINKSLLTYLTYQEQLLSSYKRTFQYASSYEGFVELIEKCEDIEELKQIRYHIITEIMHSTTLNGLKTEHETAHQSHKKADMLRNRDLKRYVNQLRVAKTRCEKRFIKLGGEEYVDYFTDEPASNHCRGHKVISFKLTMHSLACRGAFHAFLKADDSESLLEYWVAVETLKSCDPGDRHRLGAEIYNKYVASRVSLVKLDKAILKEMESFLLANRGPEAFYDAQDIICRQLEKIQYPQFLVSDIYHKFIVSWDGSEVEETQSFGSSEDYHSEGKEFLEADGNDIEIQQTASEYNKKKVADIDERIYNKTKAYQGISSQRLDAASHEKYTPVMHDLKREIDMLKLERRALEAHQEQVDSWWKHVGLWNATTVQYELVKEDDGWIVYYVIMIRLQDQLTASATDRNGWVITRTYRQIKELYYDVCQLALPSKVRLGKPSDEYIQKSMQQITHFLQSILADKTLSQSAELFNFVSSHPHLNTDHVHKPALFRVQKLFKRKATDSSMQEPAELLFYNLSDDGPKEPRSKDYIARPLYTLAAEIFELSSKFLRKTVVQLVQVTYGKSINRQIRETVDWMVSEPMLVYYLKCLKDLLWIDKELVAPAPAQTAEEMRETKAMARAALTRNIPELVIKIFGEKTAQKGFIKLFEVFQYESLNKHFLYVLLSKYTDRLLPEILASSGE